MARVLNPGDSVKGYEIVSLLNRGAMAISYQARSAARPRVFLKQYKSPSPTVAWFEEFQKLQKEVTRRANLETLRSFCVAPFDVFVARAGGDAYFQVFDFVDGGKDLSHLIEEFRTRNDEETRRRRLVLGRRLAANIRFLHAAGIVHCDLKPANLHLLASPGTTAGWDLRLIDMDFSILADRAAPWHGRQGYVGSPRYFSPEHLAEGVPGPHSDVFSLSLILYELLSGEHPYPLDDDEYGPAVRRHRAARPRLDGRLPDDVDSASLSGALHACLSPDPSRRPTAQALQELMLSSSAVTAPVARKRPSPKSEVKLGPVPVKAPLSEAPKPAPARSLRLCAEGGKDIAVSIRTEVGKVLLRALGEDARFLSDPQFILECEGPVWFVVPAPGATNQTLLNGKALLSRSPLSVGDVLAVGNEAKGIAKLPLKVAGT